MAQEVAVPFAVRPSQAVEGDCFKAFGKSELGTTLMNECNIFTIHYAVGDYVSCGFTPRFFAIVGKIFPALWGYKLLAGDGFYFGKLWPLVAILLAAAILCGFLLKRLQSE